MNINFRKPNSHAFNLLIPSTPTATGCITAVTHLIILISRYPPVRQAKYQAHTLKLK